MNARTVATLVFEGASTATAGELRLYRTCAALNAALVPLLFAYDFPLLASVCLFAAVYGYGWLAFAQAYPLRTAWRFSCPAWRIVRLLVIGNTGVFHARWRMTP
jgi:hypothetical protein